MTRKYQVGIQRTVLAIIQEIEQLTPKLKYITTSQVVTEMEKIMPDMENHNKKVKQALYQLQKETKLKKQRIKKVYSRSGVRKGWAPVPDTEKDKKK